MPARNLPLEKSGSDLGPGVSIIDPLTDPRWDAFVEQHPFGWITHLSAWKKTLESAFSHMHGYYLALCESDGTIRAALPLYSVESWLTGKRLVSIPFATLSDPLVTDPNDMARLFTAAVGLLEQLQLPRMEIRAFSSSPILSGCGCVSLCSNKAHFLKLCNDPDRVRSVFHRTCVKQRISRAEGSGLSMVPGVDEAHLREFYLLHRMTRRRRALPPQPYTFIKSIWDAFSGTGLVDLLLAYKDGVPIAGVILFKFKSRVSVEFSAVDDKYKHLSPVHFLFWKTIRQSCVSGYHVLDFGRTSIQNKSLMEFKSHWGTETTDLPQYFYPTPPAPVQMEGSTLKGRLFRSFCSHAPDFAVTFVGDFCYRHMG
ncbi:GNAT family N-acetyltransferase [Geomonas sp. RF6]|uniref:GNAT family N-acetyltransferase n=1 Tax=Geomonas sp. RF6 TaxID=2897342 RepID=UPI001E3EBCDA|nr:GNAT family N-acetyltransferase [Geomonas sp. RF6]UFS70901.1 GNAT family N-acetyltransferase [Geomonas sp. RF6]